MKNFRKTLAHLWADVQGLVSTLLGQSQIMIGSKVKAMLSSESQMCWFCLVVELHRVGLLPTGLPRLVLFDTQFPF